MAIKIGNLDISAFKVGSADTKVYLGDTLLYPTTPPTFQGKWLATYNGGTTSSAECDASSAITNNEITKSNLVSVEIGDCVTSIDYGTFNFCTSLTRLNSDVDGVFNIPNSVTSIGENAFGNCRSLTSIDIPNSVTSIGDEAFARCSSLTSCTIGSGVTSIGVYAFYGCGSLTSITVNSNNTVYDSRNNCNAIIETNTNTLINGCNNTVIPDSVTSIGDYAFESCTSLTSINIPNSVTSIGMSAFEYCSSLTSCTIGSGVTSIGEEAFAYCTSLTSINIPNSVTSIDTSAFYGCGSLTSITCLATTPPTLGDYHVFDNTNDCPIYVPAASVSAYQSAWSTYAPRIQAIP